MNGKSLSGLIVLNVMLLSALAMFSFNSKSADAQGFQRAGDYMMISYERPNSQSYNAVVIAELNSGQLLAARYDTAGGDIRIVGYHNVTNDFAAARDEGSKSSSRRTR